MTVQLCQFFFDYPKLFIFLVCVGIIFFDSYNKLCYNEQVQELLKYIKIAKEEISETFSEAYAKIVSRIILDIIFFTYAKFRVLPKDLMRYINWYIINRIDNFFYRILYSVDSMNIPDFFTVYLFFYILYFLVNIKKWLNKFFKNV